MSGEGQQQNGGTDPNELARDVFRHELKASEKVKALYQNYDSAAVAGVMVEEYEKLLNNVEDPEKIKSVTVLMLQFGQQFDSETILQRANKEVQENPALSIE